MSKKSFARFIPLIIVLLACILFIIKLAGPNLLKIYVKGGIGDCQKIPVLCLSAQKTIRPAINNRYKAQLAPYNSPKISVSLPKGFTVVEEKITKVYYKSHKRLERPPTAYLLYEEPGFFTNLFPQVKKEGINNNYDFMRRVMSARIDDIKKLQDVFFVIMKGIFIPDLGNTRNIKMTQFKITNKDVFINYSLSKIDNYFDCNIIDERRNFFKIYIKDRGAVLDLDNVLTIVSTVATPLK